jgi:hypothetical protein
MTLASTAVKTAALLMMAPTALLPMIANAQTLAANTTPTIETAGQIAADICARRGQRGPDCIEREADRIVKEIGARARAETQQARTTTALEEAKIKAIQESRRCIAEISADKQTLLPVVLATKVVATSTEKTLTGDNACKALDEARETLKQRAQATTGRRASLTN